MWKVLDLEYLEKLRRYQTWDGGRNVASIGSKFLEETEKVLSPRYRKAHRIYWDWGPKNSVEGFGTGIFGEGIESGMQGGM